MRRGVYVDVVTSPDGDGVFMDDEQYQAMTAMQSHRYNWTAFLLITASFLCAYLYNNLIMQRLLPLVRQYIRSIPALQLPLIPEGSFMHSLIEEISFIISLSLHHLTSAFFLSIGQRLGSPLLWLTGIAIELGYEIADTYAMATNDWPYMGLKQQWVKAIPLLHHIPTMMVLPAIVRLGYHRVEDVQTLACSLIGAAAIGFLSEGVRKVMDKQNNLVGWFTIHVLSAAIVFWCRMIVFPVAAVSSLHKMQEDMSVPHYFYEICRVGLGCAMMFNCFIMGSYAWSFGWQLYRALKRSSASVASSYHSTSRYPYIVKIKRTKAN